MKLLDIMAGRGSVEERSGIEDPSVSISDVALAEFLGMGTTAIAGVHVNESTSMGLTAVYRAVSLTAGTVASLPLKTYATQDDDTRVRVTSVYDDPGKVVGLTAYEWKELIMVHLLLHGNAYLLSIYNNAGAIAGFQPIHPSAVSIDIENGRKVFKITDAKGRETKYTDEDITHIPGLSQDGIRGISPIHATRNALATGIAGDTAAARMFSNGLLLGGIVSAEGITEEQALQIKTNLTKKLSGAGSAGDIAVVNSDLKFNSWTMTADDAQFIESRRMQIEEVARIFGVPKVLLAEDGASTWGSGIAQLLNAWQKLTLQHYTRRIEERLSTRLVNRKFVEFDYAQLLAGTYAESITNMAAEITAGLLTVDEGRRILNRSPLPPGSLTPPADNNE